MTRTLLISVEPLEIPADFDAETEFRAKLAQPSKDFRAALTEALGREVGVKYEIIDSTALPAPRRGRRTKAEIAAAAAAPEHAHDAAPAAARSGRKPVAVAAE